MALVVGRHPDRVGDTAIDLWERLFKSLVMIIGTDGFDALYDRSLHLASATFPWLGAATPLTTHPSRFDHLKEDLQGQTLDEASKATVLMLATFTGVLSTLIGEQLTTNILRAAWGDAFEEAAQEISKWSTK